MAEEIMVRKAEEADAGQIHEIETMCFSEPWSLQAIESELTENPRALYLIAQVGDQIAGYAGLWRIMDEGHITNVAVRPQFRGRGIGSAILREMILRSDQQGIRHHTLEVRTGNAPAIALYRKHGFTAAGIRKQYYQKEKEDALIMWRHSGGETGD